MATDLATGEAVAFDRGPLEPALEASIAIPGLLAPVNLDGRYLVDGSLSANLPVAEARRLGATEIWAMRCSCCATPRVRFDRLPEILAQVFGFAVDRTGHDEREAFRGVTARVWRLEHGPDVGALDFAHGAELVEAAYRASCERLAGLGYSRAAPPAHAL